MPVPVIHFENQKIAAGNSTESPKNKITEEIIPETITAAEFIPGEKIRNKEVFVYIRKGNEEHPATSYDDYSFNSFVDPGIILHGLKLRNSVNRS